MPAFCIICETAVTPSTPSVKCVKCKKICHLKCCELTPSETAVNSSWTCGKCSVSFGSLNTVVSLSDIEQLFEKQFEKLKTELRSDFSKMIDEKFQLLNNRISVIENNVQNLESEFNRCINSAPKAVASITINDVVCELNDRKERSNNILIFNVPESKESKVEDRVKSDLSFINSILEPLGTFPTAKKIFRLGFPKPNVVRPLKLVFENKEEAKCILRSNKNNPSKINHFHADLTKIQRESNATTIKEFKDRKSKGESNITLNYKDNIAHISTRNVTDHQTKN
ncbi:hypothetical protein Zmor_006466 [Zophobas morio]|uniref:Phorbol-ester/DAG-type domain-containing protein n=1 Tax=Zophobas morio TaxID=2755281 RepID=A0AA38MNI8_9CUCU|nr:hypothetical protein Zmor_006466 [Zophobas morio]